MDYRPRKGIILLNICDANLLVPLREASDVCKGIASLSVFESMVWKKLETGGNMDNIILLFSKLTSKSEDEIQTRLNRFVTNLYEKGFLVIADGQN